jgi:hypothetical protein
MKHLIYNEDPLDLATLQRRRALAIEYLGQTLFIDREHGARVAAKVLAAVPMPANSGEWLQHAARIHKWNKQK